MSRKHIILLPVVSFIQFMSTGCQDVGLLLCLLIIEQSFNLIMMTYFWNLRVLDCVWQTAILYHFLFALQSQLLPSSFGSKLIVDLILSYRSVN